ncbi:transposase [Bacillus benzoevorans]|uniref:Transposase n=1 Tax=Bacillus benzoevorans TaxID=1456 RepID=A0A7X0HYC5_9BACI|nr:helix-turn-helix domain-containing protein [Bacillus benzoevorans]MBB6447846.1 transposase [Bacillus benzoevorans]
MIELSKKQNVLLMHLREGKSQREIARETGVDRKTVRKYIKEYERKRMEIQQSDDPVQTGVTVK